MISCRMASKSKNFWPGKCKNSPHSSFSSFSFACCARLFGTAFAAAATASDCDVDDFRLVVDEDGEDAEPFSTVDGFFDEPRLMSWRTSGRRVTIPVPIHKHVYCVYCVCECVSV